MFSVCGHIASTVRCTSLSFFFFAHRVFHSFAPDHAFCTAMIMLLPLSHDTICEIRRPYLQSKRAVYTLTPRGR